MILHLFPAEKFTVDYIERIKKVFDFKNHFFIIYGPDKDVYNTKDIIHYDNVLYSYKIVDIKNRFLELAKKASKVIFHSFSFEIQDIILIKKVICKKNTNTKFGWYIWGSDLYDSYVNNRKLTSIIRIVPFYCELCRIQIIKRLDIICAAEKGDYLALKNRYKLLNTHLYKQTIYSYNLPPRNETVINEKPHVMVGHSAMKMCRHIETFELLRKYAGSINVYCPLSYPKNKMYIEEVIKKGKELFGDYFYPITSYMDYERYCSFLNTIDIGVFNNSRQQGMGNITALLYYGKKVYLSKDNAIRYKYPKKTYEIFDISEIGDDSFIVPLDNEKAIKNQKRIEYTVSDEYFFKTWNDIFNC